MADTKKAEAKKPRGLGRGLSSLLDEMGPYEVASMPASAGDGPAGLPTSLPVASLHPNPKQPRRAFGEEAMRELADSVARHGVLQPLLVREEAEGRYMIIAGERRWRAAQAAGLHEVPVLVRNLDIQQMHEAAVIENVQRADLNPVEEARAYDVLHRQYGMLYAEVGAAVGKSRSHVSNLLRMLEMPPPVLEMVADGRLSLGHAKLLTTAEDPLALAEKVVAGGLSVRALEGLLKPRAQPAKVALPRKLDKDADLEALEQAITEATGLRAEVRPRGNAGGELVLRYSGMDQLDMVLQRLMGTAF